MEIKNDFASTPIDPAATANAPQPDLLQRIEAATDRAIDQHNVETKRKPGQRGPDKAPRKRKVPMGGVAEGSPSPLLEPDQAPADPGDWLSAPKPVDDETAQALAETAVELFLDGRQTTVELMAFRITGDKEIAKSAHRPVSEKLKGMLIKSAKLCLIKWGADIEHAPEYTLFGCVVIVVAGDVVQLRMLKGEMAKIRTP